MPKPRKVQNFAYQCSTIWNGVCLVITIPMTKVTKVSRTAKTNESGKYFSTPTLKRCDIALSIT